MSHQAQSTVDIFQHLFDTLPPLVPQKIKSDMESALEQVSHNFSLSQESVEKTLITFGKQTWPYREAYTEMVGRYEGQVAESFFFRRLEGDIKKKYKQFTHAGGSFRELYAGRPVSLFTSEERQTIAELLVQVRRDVRGYTNQAVLSDDKERYEAKIHEFQEILEDIETQLSDLRMLADKEQEHPSLAAEIHEHVRAFEQSLCLLGPRLSHEHVFGAKDVFVGRKREKQDHQLQQ